MKIAAAAYPIEWHNRWNEYVGKLRVWVRTAAEQGAELLVFPEYGALELASLAGAENARDPGRLVDAVNAIRAGSAAPTPTGRLARAVARAGLPMPATLGLKDLIARLRRTFWTASFPAASR